MAVKLLIIAVKRKINFWLIPGQFMVIPVKKMKVIFDHLLIIQCRIADPPQRVFIFFLPP